MLQLLNILSRVCPGIPGNFYIFDFSLFTNGEAAGKRAQTLTHSLPARPVPSEAMDPALAKIRDERGYSYADIITVHPDHLPEFETKVRREWGAAKWFSWVG